jgi:hypothetical protein
VDGLRLGQRQPMHRDHVGSEVGRREVPAVARLARSATSWIRQKMRQQPVSQAAPRLPRETKGSVPPFDRSQARQLR